MITADGVMVTEPWLIKIEAACHFQNFLQQVPTEVMEVDLEELSGLIDHKCSRDEAALLIRAVQADEIRDVIFSMSSNKAPRPDGYSM